MWLSLPGWQGLLREESSWKWWKAHVSALGREDFGLSLKLFSLKIEEQGGMSAPAGWGGVLARSHDPTNSADDQSQYTVSYTMSKAFLPLLGSGVNFRKAYYKGCWGHALEEALASWPPSPSSLHPVCIGLSNSALAFILRHKDLYCRPKRSGHAGNLPKSLIQANHFSSETEDLGHFIQKIYSYQLLLNVQISHF